MVDEVLQHGRRVYTAGVGQAFMPVEFSGACYRFGHSMVRPSYRANLKGDGGNPFFGFIFDPGQNGASADPADLRGGFTAPRRFIGWQTFFDFGDGQVKRNKRIDTHLSTPLFTLPLGAIASHDPPTVLPQRTLLRHLTWSLPSGQSVAAAMGVAPIGKHDLIELKPYGFDRSTPLWYYALKEAQLSHDGLQLGPVAGRIVAEVLIGLLQTDTASYLVGESVVAADLRHRGDVQDDRLPQVRRRRPGHAARAGAEFGLIGEQLGEPAESSAHSSLHQAEREAQFRGELPCRETGPVHALDQDAVLLGKRGECLVNARASRAFVAGQRVHRPMFAVVGRASHRGAPPDFLISPRRSRAGSPGFHSDPSHSGCAGRTFEAPARFNRPRHEVRELPITRWR